MNKRITLILVICTIIAILVGCKNTDKNKSNRLIVESIGNTEEKENSAVPILGTWIVKNYEVVGVSTLSDEEAKKYIGKEILIAEDRVNYIGTSIKNPRFKVQIVKAEDYFFNQFNVSTESLGINNKEIEVIEVFSESDLFKTFIKINDSRIITNIDNTFLFFKK